MNDVEEETMGNAILISNGILFSVVGVLIRYKNGSISLSYFGLDDIGEIITMLIAGFFISFIYTLVQMQIVMRIYRKDIKRKELENMAEIQKLMQKQDDDK